MIPILKIESTLQKDISNIEKQLLRDLEKIIDDYSVRGVLQYSENLSELENKILEALRKAGYPEAMNKFFEAFPLLGKSIFDEYKISEIKSQRQQRFINYATDQLRGKTFQNEVVNLFSETIRSGALNEMPRSQMVENLSKIITEKQPLSNYVTNTASTLIGQYDGVVNQDIFEKFKPTKFYYISSIVENSRPICDHIKDKFGSRSISIDELKVVLDEYAPNGVPSEDRITFETVNDKVRTMKKGSGMVDGTTVENFSIVRGGYNCRHQVRWDLTYKTLKN